MSRNRKRTNQRNRSTSNPAASAEDAFVIGPGLVFGLVGVAVLAGMVTLWAFGALGGQRASQSPSGQPAESPSEPSGVEGTAPAAAPSIGRADAPVSIVEFSDYQCPNCRQFALEVMPWLKKDWIDPGFVRVEFRDFAVRGPASVAAAEAAHCAGDQGAYWPYHDALFEASGGTNARPLEEATFVDLAEGLGLDSEALGECIASGRHRQRVQESTAFASGQGFEGTPTYLINGRKTQGAINIADWDQLFRLYQQDFARATQAAP